MKGDAAVRGGAAVSRDAAVRRGDGVKRAAAAWRAVGGVGVIGGVVAAGVFGAVGVWVAAGAVESASQRHESSTVETTPLHRHRADSAPRDFIGKPTAPIAVEHTFAAPPSVAQPVVVTISVTPGVDLTGAVLSLAAEEPLVLIEPVAGIDVAVGDVGAGETAEVTVTVLPLTDATHYLGVTVTGVIAGMPQARSVSVPIRLAGGAKEAAGQDAAGQSVASAPDAGARAAGDDIATVKARRDARARAEAAARAEATAEAAALRESAAAGAGNAGESVRSFRAQETVR